MGYYEGYARKEGVYEGDHFDSQLEGQYARFFHLAFGRDGYRRCDINHGDYFGLKENVRYRPDFYLPKVHFFDCDQVGAYVEVKPTLPNDDQLRKMENLCSATGKRMILVMGSPIFTQINNIEDDNPKSAWIIDADGRITVNNRFLQSFDRHNISTIYIADYEKDGIHIGDNFIVEAEEASKLRFEDGVAILNGDAPNNNDCADETFWESF